MSDVTRKERAWPRPSSNSYFYFVYLYEKGHDRTLALRTERLKAAYGILTIKLISNVRKAYLIQTVTLLRFFLPVGGF